ncbi:hypothetical protein TNIN_103171 [Trichonephila inaurata madagascariensis]|uniref:Uncharacterized protein n=1 Tax=Trichonephila inaurata madagascariensis TaxID=2747483 RepID=A0A8X6KCC3_9ARAC|nr:hypothetical protein TNIN_103171 [Trichonephila inaurata madagascariensis]
MKRTQDAQGTGSLFCSADTIVYLLSATDCLALSLRCLSGTLSKRNQKDFWGMTLRRDDDPPNGHFCGTPLAMTHFSILRTTRKKRVWRISGFITHFGWIFQKQNEQSLRTWEE